MAQNHARETIVGIECNQCLASSWEIRDGKSTKGNGANQVEQVKTTNLAEVACDVRSRALHSLEAAVRVRTKVATWKTNQGRKRSHSFDRS